MSLETIEARTPSGPAYARCLLPCLYGAVMLGAASACSTLFDAPSFERAASGQVDQVLEEAVRERIEALQQQGRERIGDWSMAGKEALQRVIVFPKPSGAVGISDRGWPVMRIDKVAAQRQPQLVLEAPVRGVVFLDEREIGLVQDGSARIVTLVPGEHQIRIEHPLTPPMMAQFYIETGERITLRWESR
ncbi:hypothetical protein [Thauera butanivorans]|uniref:hypothetical protein n=1 Tax=Thauera butanivorans TaxID=86174 RepID=UPI0012F8C9AF|nr:hypothetical protein [Thauera butanivorans]